MKKFKQDTIVYHPKSNKLGFVYHHGTIDPVKEVVGVTVNESTIGSTLETFHESELVQIDKKAYPQLIPPTLK